MTTTTSQSGTTASGAGHKSYEELIQLVREAALLGSSASLLSWDQEVMMPEGGVEYRSRQLSLLARLTHEASTSPRIGELLSICEDDDALTADPISPEAVNIRELRRHYDRKTKLPSALVAEEAALASR